MNRLLEAKIGESVTNLLHPKSSEAPSHDVLFLVGSSLIIMLAVDSRSDAYCQTVS